MDRPVISTLCLIPARSGSKGIPGKNVRLCNGKPLISFTIDTALRLFDPNDVVVSSDDVKALELAELQGVVALERPIEIAQDDTPMIDVIKHAIMTTGKTYQRLLLLQPTSPYRNEVEILEALSRLEEEDADLIASVSPVPEEFSPYLMIDIRDGLMCPLFPGKVPTRRQDAPRTFLRNGQFYAMRTMPIVNGFGLYDGKILAFETEDKGINLDTEGDWANFLARENKNHTS